VSVMWRRTVGSKYQLVGGARCIGLHTALNVKVACTSETTVPLCQTTKTSSLMYNTLA
jgi:hypothetical protein